MLKILFHSIISIKSPPKSSFIKAMHKFTRPFYNEVTWYKDLAPVLSLANGENCIDRILPKCYFAYSNYYMQEAGNAGNESCCTKSCPWFCYVPCKPSEEGILILENIRHRQQSYKVFKKLRPMDLQHVTLLMKELANFHGMWLKYKFMAQKGALEAKERRGSDGVPVKPIAWEKFEKNQNTQKRMPKIAYNQLKKVAKRTVLHILSQCEGSTEAENINKCRRFFDQTASRKLSEYFGEEAKPVYTLCHGDFWSNNILFTYADDNPDIPTSLVIIDYQLINVGNPCYDLVYFLYLNTDLDFRDQHLKACLKLYYDQFSTYFEGNLTYSFEEFLQDFDRFKAIGFTTACSVMPNILSDSEVELEGNPLTALRNLQRKQREDMEDMNSECGQEIKRRIIDLVHEMARDGVI